MVCLLHTNGRVLCHVWAFLTTSAALTILISAAELGTFTYTAGNGNAQYSTANLWGSRPGLSCFYDAAGPQQLGHRLGQQPVRGLKATSTSVYSFEFRREEVVSIGSGEGWWRMVWSSRGTRPQLNDFSVWEVRPERIPEGFVCLSPFFFRVDPRGLGLIFNPPTDCDVHGMVAVSAFLVRFVPATKLTRLWTDAGSGALRRISVYTGPDNLGLFAFPSCSSPLGSIFVPILDHSRGSPYQVPPPEDLAPAWPPVSSEYVHHAEEYRVAPADDEVQSQELRDVVRLSKGCSNHEQEA